MRLNFTILILIDCKRILISVNIHVLLSHGILLQHGLLSTTHKNPPIFGSIVFGNVFSISLLYRDNASDTSSISQTSYDPSKPMFSGMASEIPDSGPAATDDASSGGVVLLSSKSKGDACKPLKLSLIFIQ